MISFEDGHKVCYDSCDLCCHSDLLLEPFFFQIKYFCIFFYWSERPCPFPLLSSFLLLSSPFFRWKIKKGSRGIGNKEKKNNESSNFLLQDFWSSAAKWEISNFLKILIFFSAISSCFSNFVYIKKNLPKTSTRRGSTSEVFLFI